MARRDGAATRQRILDAAITEFAANGLAGGRVDRIAAAAQANPRAIYVNFTDKEGLFDAVLEQVLGDLVTAVRIDPDDLPDYAGRLFDYLVTHPAAGRMILWRQLERPQGAPTYAAVYADKVKHVAAADAALDSPTPSGFPATDLLALVTGLASGYLMSPVELLNADGRDPYSPTRLAEHRSHLVEATRRLTTPPT